MKPFEYLEHTADAKFRAYGATLEEAYANAALAMTSLLFPYEKVTPVQGKRIEAVGRTKQTLLFEFLQGILFALETQDFLLARVDELEIKSADEGKFRLQCRLVGDDVAKYVLDAHIKSATYSEMEIREEPGDCMVQVVVDI